MATWAPSAMKRRAVAKPMPLLPPVMRAFFPASFITPPLFVVPDHQLWCPGAQSVYASGPSQSAKPASFEFCLLDKCIATWLYSYMAIYEQLDPLGLTFSALADPTRRAILARLASGDADVSELMKPFALSQPTISKHLNVLERAGLFYQAGDTYRRHPPLVAVPLKDFADWVEPFRRLWEGKFASLDDYLKQMQKKEKQRGRAKR